MYYTAIETLFSLEVFPCCANHKVTKAQKLYRFLDGFVSWWFCARTRTAVQFSSQLPIANRQS
jgi:hypothetical protein